ncbi:MAG: hypothetical protein AAF645_26265 [Myxococcota bacterium]
MLERAALHQTRFRTPGVTPDARGVLLGQKGAVLFPSLDRLIAFLRAYSSEGSLDDLLPSLTIGKMVTSLKTREVLLSFAAESSYRMDRIAGIAKIAGGMVFTGTSRHFVKYRDSASPLGYDVLELQESVDDVVLYHDAFVQGYQQEGTVDLRQLVLKLTPQRARPDEMRSPSPRYWLTAETGVGHAILNYIFRWRVSARAALVEWAPESAFDDQGKRLHLFEIADPPERILELFDALPGVHVYEPGPGYAVEYGFRHPIELESASALFDDASLVLFRGVGNVLTVNPLPPFAPVRSLVRTDLGQGRSGDVGTGTEAPAIALDLRLAPTREPWRRVTATFVPLEHQAWLARLLYGLPPRTLASVSMASASDGFYLLDEGGIEGVPLGTFHTEVGERIYVPAGMTLVPAVSPRVLDDLLRERGNGFAFFDDEGPRVIAADAFGPVSRRVLRQLAPSSVSASALGDDGPGLPLLRYDKPRRLPLWGFGDEDDAT